MPITRRLGLALAGAMLVATPFAALAESHGGGTVHEVQMLNKDPETGDAMVFEPALIRAMPGDTIKFIATDKGHNSVGEEDMIPEGAEPWKSKINQDFEITLDVEGAYGFNCQPHATVGMVGLILVGEVDNLDALKEVRQRGRAGQRYDELFAEAEEMLAGESS